MTHARLGKPTSAERIDPMELGLGISGVVTEPMSARRQMYYSMHGLLKGFLPVGRGTNIPYD